MELRTSPHPPQWPPFLAKFLFISPMAIHSHTHSTHPRPALSASAAVPLIRLQIPKRDGEVITPWLGSSPCPASSFLPKGAAFPKRPLLSDQTDHRELSPTQGKPGPSNLSHRTMRSPKTSSWVNAQGGGKKLVTEDLAGYSHKCLLGSRVTAEDKQPSLFSLAFAPLPC